ncbi:M12 family metallo-peptidase [Parabacteroides sp. APC149_11_2_Y6]
MKKVLLAAGILLALSSCSKDDRLVPNKPEQAAEPVRIDLRALDYEGVMTLLSEQTSLKDVTFTDGDFTRTVLELVASDDIDPDQADLLVFNSSDPTDSVELTVSPEYVAVRLTADSKLLAYLSYADGRQQAEVAGLYEQVAPATRGGESLMTRSADNNSLRLDLSGIREEMKAGNVYELPERELQYQPAVATRGFFSNLFNKVKRAFKGAPAPVPKIPTVDIYLLREKGSNPVTHEMNWQVNDAISALKDVQGNVKFNVNIRNCDFRGSSNSNKAIDDFRTWVNNSQYRNTDGIFILCRWGGWNDNVLGRAYVGDYNVNNDLKAYGISATNAWNKFTMAHEIGHIFGAEHVTPKWYQIFWTADLMSANSYDWLGSGKHKDDANREEIKKRLTLN